MSHGTSRGSSRRSSSTTPPRAGSSSTTSPPPRVRVPQHVARLVAPLVVDYSALRRLVVDYFASVARPGASARRAARHAAHRAARHRLLCLAQARRRLHRLRRASGCLGTSRGSSCGSSHRSSSTTSPTLRVWVPCSLRSSLSTTSPMLCDRVPRPLARFAVDLAPSSPLDFSSVDRTGSRRMPVTPSRGSGTRCLVALAQLPMSCIRTRRLHCSTTRHRSHQQSAQVAQLSHLFK
jgi:hypothetical protein